MKLLVALVALVLIPLGCASGQASRGRGDEPDAAETETGGATGTGGKPATGGSGGKAATGGTIAGPEAGVAIDADAPPPDAGAGGAGGEPGPTSDDPPCQRMVEVGGAAALGPALMAAKPGDCP